MIESRYSSALWRRRSARMISHPPDSSGPSLITNAEIARRYLPPRRSVGIPSGSVCILRDIVTARSRATSCSLALEAYSADSQILEIQPPPKTKRYPLAATIAIHHSGRHKINIAHEFGPIVHGPLGWIVHARSGDKGSYAKRGFESALG